MAEIQYSPPLPEITKGLGWAGALLGLLALALFRFRSRAGGSDRSGCAVGLTLASQPLYLLTLPGLDVVMTPKAIGAELRRYIGQPVLDIAKIGVPNFTVNWPRIPG